MAPSHTAIERFVAFVRRRLNGHCLGNASIWGVAAGAGALAGVALTYVVQGYAVPPMAFGAAAAVAFATSSVLWMRTRFDVDQSARFVDRFYKLQDAVASYLHFSRANQRDGFYALQAAQTERRVAQLSADAVTYHPPRRGLMLAAGLVAVAIPLSLRGPSADVLERLRLEKATQEYIAAVKPELEELVEELAKSVDDPFERELVDPEQLRKWVQELAPTGDQKEAFKQFAQLERKLNRALLATQSRRDEQILRRAAEELQAAEETRPLGDELANKKYQHAAEKLAAMQPEQRQPASAARKNLARLKAAAQRMAAAAKANRAGAKASSSGAKSSSSAAKSKTASPSSNSGSQAASSQANAGEAGKNADSGEDGALSENLQELDAAVAELDEALDAAEKQEKQYGQCDKETGDRCTACEGKVGSQINKLCKSLGRLSVRRKAENKLNRLCKACSQCQGGLGECQSGADSPNPGGKKAGWGSSAERRDERDELLDNGQTTQLQGIKGDGPSIATVEEADDGSGVSTRRAEARERQFSQQIESFVQREDVPEQVKRGVKNYFQLIHQMQTEQSPPPQETDAAETQPEQTP